MKNDGFGVWFDDWEIKVGDSITEKIGENLEDNSFFVIVVSEYSRESEWVKKELNITLMRSISKKDVKILPVLLNLSPEDMPLLLRDIKAARFSEERINESEYYKLIEPIQEKKKADSLHQFQDVFFETVEHIDLILQKNRPGRREIEIILELLEEEKYRRYFFKKVESVMWFKILKDRGFFSPDKRIKVIKNENGSLSSPFWDVLPYLERVSRQVGDGDDEIIRELLDIIENISNYRDSSGEHINNFRLWWSLAKILANIPKDKIPIEIIDLIKIWLEATPLLAVPGSEIMEKLLPKFLSDTATEEDISKAERIVDIVTDFRWKEGIGFRGEKEEPVMLVKLHYLEKALLSRKYANRLGEKGTGDIIFKIANKLKCMLTRMKSESWIEADVDDRFYKIKASHKEDFQFDCSIGIIEKDQLEGDTKEKKWVNSLNVQPTELAAFKIEDCRNYESFKSQMESRLENVDIPLEARSELSQQIKNLYENIFDDHSFIWFRHISPGGGGNFRDPKEFIAHLLKEMVLARVRIDKSFFKRVYGEFRGENYQFSFFRRLVFFLIGEFWPDFKTYFWEIVDKTGGVQIFDNPNYEAELHNLLEKNVGKLTGEEKERLKGIIDKGPLSHSPDSDDTPYTHYWKQKWYSALKSDPSFKNLYEEMKKRTGAEEKIGYEMPSAVVGPGPSPLSPDKILNTSNTDLAKILKEFRPGHPIEGPTTEGLMKAVGTAAKEKPGKFLEEELAPFLDVPYNYISTMLRSFQEAFKEKKPFNWGKLLGFIKRYIDREEFWNDTFKDIQSDWHATHKWVVGNAAELIEDGTRDDTWAFAEKYLPDAREIILIMAKKLKVEDEAVEDPVSHSLNTPIGKIAMALKNLSLRMARLKFKTSDEPPEIWDKDLKSVYDDLLKRKIVDAYTLLGRHMPNLYYLDKSWVEEKIKEYENLEEESLWSAFVIGCLSMSNIHEQFYGFLQGHFYRAIDFGFKEDEERHLVDHIAVNYLRGKEGISTDGPFSRMLVKWKSSQVKELIRFFWRIGNDLFEKDLEKEAAEKMRGRIIEFWRWLYSKYKDETSLNEEDKKILGDASKLAVILPAVDQENFNWLILSASHLGEFHDSFLMIEYLDRLKNRGDKLESAKFIGKIFKKMLEVSTPEFDPEHIVSIVEFIIEAGDNETYDLAAEICNTYGKRGYDFLRDTYERYKR